MKRVIITIFTLAFAIFLYYAIGEKRCIEVSDRMHTPYKYSMYSGCFIYYKHGYFYDWIEYDKIKFKGK